VCYTERMSGTCPICAKPAAPRSKNPSAPFCSARCRQIDLGKWLNQEYRIPTNDVVTGSADGGTVHNEDAETSNDRLAAGNRKEPPS